MMMKSGIIVTCVGIIIMARYNFRMTSLPRKRIFANANAAMLAEISVINVKDTDTKRLFPIVRMNGKRENTSW